MQSITIAGAGVIGLSTALVLEERGYDVRIVARATGDATTSAVAGAVWFPYRAGPKEKVAVWAARTRAYLLALAASDPTSGVDVLDGYEIEPEPRLPWWAMGLPDVTHVPAPVTGSPLAWRFAAPRVEPAIFLPWLAAKLRAPIEIATIESLADLPGDVVVNCTGLGARTLCNDVQLEPLLGQVAIALPGAADLNLSVTDERDRDAIFYVIPRRGELVLGGCSIPTAWAPIGGEAGVIVDDAITARILDQARRLGIPVGDVLRVRAGLRPYRPEVRLERDPIDPRIIHNYGHGGAGYTMSRGCAEDVAHLIAK